ncbi:hypothetical protein PLICRDRAFT_698822 [Plicaturopsis crispa FD-325 SS-3]|nr:hypothetical protein PLICRDRAFT_698822 [Plicaturopsis crispa FD-325 SS-3]
MSSSALDDIWDEPVASSSRPSPRPRQDSDSDNDAHRPAKRRRSSQLFLPDSDDEDDIQVSEPAAAKAPTSSVRPDIDAMFADLDDDEDLAFAPLPPSLDRDALRKQADAKHAAALSLTPHAIAPSSSPPRDFGDDAKKGRNGEEKKERKKVARLDETRLLGPDGFPALIQSTKGFKSKGKGHEVQDLNRLLNIYQFWTHKMYPKTQFRDTVQRIEKLCHSRRMHVALSVWHDEAKGIVKGEKADDAIDLASDAEVDDEAADNDRGKNDTSRSSLPPSSASEPDGDDFDIDALIREEEERAADLARQAAAAAPSTSNDDDEEALWGALGEMPPSSSPARPPPARDEFDEMWDMAREMEDEMQMQVDSNGHGDGEPMDTTGGRKEDVGRADKENEKVGEAEVLQAEAAKPTNSEGWDDMYL